MIAGTRDRLIHGYHGVDLDIVWNTAPIELPAVLPLIQSLIERLAEQP